MSRSYCEVWSRTPIQVLQATQLYRDIESEQHRVCANGYFRYAGCNNRRLLHSFFSFICIEVEVVVKL